MKNEITVTTGINSGRQLQFKDDSDDKPRSDGRISIERIYLSGERQSNKAVYLNREEARELLIFLKLALKEND